MSTEIGKQIQINGEVCGEEDLIIHGRVTGKITLTNNHVVLEPSAVIDAAVCAKDVTIRGEIHGDSEASDKLEIAAGANIEGNLSAPRVVMEEGARFRGFINMTVELPKELDVSQQSPVADSGFEDEWDAFSSELSRADA